MTEQYKDAYQSKYREETVQVHAPLSLIEKTKAAMREEEKRLAAAQRKGSSAESVAASESELRAKTASAGVLGRQEERAAAETGHANRKKQSWVFSVRKWAYPLTAAAAILILVSVSLTMRGMKSANRLDTASPAAFDGTAPSGAVCEEAAADEGYESAEVTALERPMAESAAGAAESVEDMAEAPAEAPAADSFTAIQNTGGVKSADRGQTNGPSREETAADMAAPAEEMREEAAEKAENENSERGLEDQALQKSAADAQKQEALSGQQREDADYDDYTIEKVAKRPSGFNDPEVKIRRYEGKTFRVLEMTGRGNDSEKAWTAYVEVSAGEGYVICGEAETEEDFLAAAYKKLEEE